MFFEDGRDTVKPHGVSGLLGLPAGDSALQHGCALQSQR